MFTGLLSGWRIYALVALVAAFGALYGYARIEHYRADAATAEAKRVAAQRDDIANRLAQAEIDKAELTARQQELDKAIVERDKRAKELEHEKQAFKDELEQLKPTLPQADQDCLSRPLPDAIVSLLRIGPDHPDAPAKTASTGSPPLELPQP